jgi:hypothetical protein
MSQKEFLIVLAHATSCSACRSRLLAEPDTIFRSRSLTEGEKETLSHLKDSDFTTNELLARASGVRTDDLRAYADHAVVRLRHF